MSRFFVRTGPIGILLLVLGASACGSGFARTDLALFEVVPSSVSSGDTLELRGQAFGERQAEGFVSVGGSLAPVQAWTDDRILVEVPSVGPGEVLVLVSWPTERTEALPLTVLP